jgi:hypothetical protein
VPEGSAAALVLLAAWCAACVFVRKSPAAAYGAFVAQFTPYIMLFPARVAAVGDRSVEPDNIAFRRIESNLVFRAAPAPCCFL